MQSKINSFENSKQAQSFSCENCLNRQGPIMEMAGKKKVRCFGSIRDFRSSCHNWTDGSDLEAMLQFAQQGYIVQKGINGQENIR